MGGLSSLSLSLIHRKIIRERERKRERERDRGGGGGEEGGTQ